MGGIAYSDVNTTQWVCFTISINIKPLNKIFQTRQQAITFQIAAILLLINLHMTHFSIWKLFSISILTNRKQKLGLKKLSKYYCNQSRLITNEQMQLKFSVWKPSQVDPAWLAWAACETLRGRLNKIFACETQS